MNLRLALPLVLLVAVACGSDEHFIELSTRPNDSAENLPEGMLLGDSLTLYARELDASGSPTASFGHQTFTWSSPTPAIFSMPASGLVVSKAIGAGQVAVKGLKAERTVTLWVYPADARIQLSPRDTTIDIGQTITMSSTVLYGASTVFQDAVTSRVTLLLAFTGTSPLEPVPGSATRFRALRSGAVWIKGSIDVYKRSTIRDSIRVTVR